MLIVTGELLKMNVTCDANGEDHGGRIVFKRMIANYEGRPQPF
jgi:hypothetical protein